MPPPGPVKIGHKKDGRQRRPHRFHVSRPPPYPTAGSATDSVLFVSIQLLVNIKGKYSFFRVYKVLYIFDKSAKSQGLAQSWCIMDRIISFPKLLPLDAPALKLSLQFTWGGNV